MWRLSVKDSILSLIDSMKEKTVDKDLVLSEELLCNLSYITAETGREVALFVNRNGKVLDIIIGDIDSVPIKEYREKRSLDRLSGVRCVHTHPGGSGIFSDLDISALERLKLDLLVSLGIQKGQIRDSYIAYIDKSEALGVAIEGPYSLEELLSINAFDLISHIEDDFDRTIDESINIAKEKEEAILVGINGIEELDELSELLETAGGTEIGRVAQNKHRINSAYFIGKGKLKELAEEIQIKNPDLVIVDEELSGAQVRNLEESLGVRVIDRTQVILDIFARNANSREGKLQVELAQLKYLLPRLVGYGVIMSRTGGGIGTRGPGETKLEVDRRRIREKINELQKEIEQIKKHRDIQRKQREGNVFRVSLVGYTNSGKSSLLNSLSCSNVGVEDKLFATLDPTTRRIELKGGREIVVTDTVGFINKLPHDLIDAFKSTLEEALYSDLLIHVVDGSNENYETQIKVVNQVLGELGVKNKPIVIAVNKIDKLNDGEKPFIPISNLAERVVYISAKEKMNLIDVMDAIEYYATLNSEIVEIFLPYSHGHLTSYLHENGRVLESEYKNEGIYLKGEFNSLVIGRIQEFIL